MQSATQHTLASRLLGMASAAAAFGLFGLASLPAAEAQDAPVRHHRLRAHGQQMADNHPLTVRRFYRPLRAPFIEGEEDLGPGFVRSWDDPRLETFYGWRLGGDNFYGDEAGDPITRGNAGLGAIAGYGPANGGYGGPHFDSVGGFHNGPGPGAREAADYASGSISRPVYDRPLPRYPSLKAQVAALDTGIAGTGQVTRAPTPREHWASVVRARFETARPWAEDAPVAPEPDDDRPDF